MNRTRLLRNRHRPPRRAVGGKGSGAGKERDWEPRRSRLQPRPLASLTPFVSPPRGTRQGRAGRGGGGGVRFRLPPVRGCVPLPGEAQNLAGLPQGLPLSSGKLTKNSERYPSQPWKECRLGEGNSPFLRCSLNPGLHYLPTGRGRQRFHISPLRF